MHPDIDDVLSGVQRLLLNDFVPTLAASAPFLAEQAMYANLILEYCKKRAPEQHLALAEEHGDLCATLDGTAAALRSDTAASDVVAAIDAELASGRTDVARTTLDTVATRNRALRELVSRVVVYLDHHDEPASPAVAVRVVARRTTDAYLVRAADRQYAALQQLGLIW
jgi:uncharacterized protein YdbL (DUF1318 family)